MCVLGGNCGVVRYIQLWLKACCFLFAAGYFNFLSMSIVS